MVILLNELQNSHSPLKIHNERRVAKTNGLEINQGNGCGVIGWGLMFWVDFHFNYISLSLVLLLKDMSLIQKFLLNNNLVYPKVSVQEGRL